MKQRTEFSLDLLHVWTLCSLVFAQPLFDLLDRHAAFFVVRKAGVLDVFGLICLLCLVIPAGLMSLEIMARGVNRQSQKWLHVVQVACLLTLLGLLALKTSGPHLWLKWGAGGGMLGLAGGIGVAGAVCYASFSAVRSFFTVLSPAIVLFPVVFVLSADITPLVFPHTTAAQSLAQVVQDVTPAGHPTPVVVLVLDELPLTSLLDEDYQIDAVRYPHFARLAQDATWFRNAVTVSGDTIVAVPAILSGTGPKPTALPTYVDYPHNIFTLLHRTHDMHVVESHTMLCPNTICQEPVQYQAFGDRFTAMLSDLSIVYLHLLLPDDFAAALPAVTQTWKDFVRDSAGTALPVSQEPDMETVAAKARTFYSHRAAVFRKFIEAIGATDTSTLHVLHTLLPHVPWKYFPSGTVYTQSGMEIPGLSLKIEEWGDNEALVVQAYQRHLLQVEFVDGLIGKLMTRLQEVQLYDPGLIVVTADHGASFWPNASRRVARGSHAADILRVPLFIKAPFQKNGLVSDRRVSVIDIVPTIADTLGIESTWQPGGHAIFSFSIICSDEAAIPIITRAVRGHVDKIEVQEDQLVIAGWAADLRHAEPAADILIFENGKLIHADAPNIDRPDVVRVHHTPSLLRAGFHYVLPWGGLGRPLQLQIFGVSSRRRASELYQQEGPALGVPAQLPTFEAPAEPCRQLPQPRLPPTFLAQIKGFPPDMFDSDSERANSNGLPSSLTSLQSSLARKLTLLGNGKQGSRVFARSRYQALVGRSVQQLSITGVSPLRARLDPTQQRFDVQSPVRFVPAHITGTLTGRAERAAGQPGQDILAVAINGTIQDVMPSFLGPQDKERFSLFVPENAFQIGPNEPAFFLISGQETAPQLKRVNFSWRPAN